MVGFKVSGDGWDAEEFQVIGQMRAEMTSRVRIEAARAGRVVMMPRRR
jgi:hypothetical protein